MSRSIHQTRRDLREARRYDYSDSKRKAKHLQHIGKALSKKHDIKEQSLADRDRSALLPTDPDSIPIRVIDSSKFIHYPASPDDIRSVLGLLPKGVTDGIQAIKLCMWPEFREQLTNPSRFFRKRSPLSPKDLCSNYPHYQMWTGAFAGWTSGLYFSEEAEICLSAYVYDESVSHSELWELYLRLDMLTTLNHEIAHHYDHSARTARGRWLANDYSKVEGYAEKMEEHWRQHLIVPYLQQSYPETIAQFEVVLSHYGGEPLSLFDFLNASVAIDSLADAITKGDDFLQIRIKFAEGLHHSDKDTMAQNLIDRVLAQAPEHLGALTLRADICWSYKRYEEAQTLAERVLSIDENYVEAWKILSQVHKSRLEWQALLTTATRAIDLHEKSGSEKTFALRDRIEVQLELGDLSGAKADIEELESAGTSLSLRIAARLRMELTKYPNF